MTNSDPRFSAATEYADREELALARLRAAVTGEEFEWELYTGDPFDDVQFLLAAYDRLTGTPAQAVGEHEALAWHCCDERYPWIQGIVTTSEITLDAWRDSGIKYQPLYPLASQASPAATVETDPLYDSRNPNHGRMGGLRDTAAYPDINDAAHADPGPHERSSAVNVEGWQPSEGGGGPNGCGYYTAAIDIPIENDPFGPRLHYAAIEFHAKDKAVAERRRDAVLAAITTAQPQAARVSLLDDELLIEWGQPDVAISIDDDGFGYAIRRGNQFEPGVSDKWSGAVAEIRAALAVSRPQYRPADVEPRTAAGSLD